jgi:crotonobetainyl-CoA:carnitine CoA-transferase CaiB-like acyl-CoA transferase
MSGLMSITGEGPGRPPVKKGAPNTDITAGILGAMAIAAAYAHKLKTGEGQMIDTSLFEAGIVHTYWQSAIGLATGTPPGPLGTAHPLNAPYQAFQTEDGWITIGAANQNNWERFLEVLDAPALARDPRFKKSADRMTHVAELADLVGKIIITRSTDDWLGRFRNAGVPAGPVLNVNEMHRDPHTLARDMVVEVDHPKLGPVKTIGLPVHFSGTPGKVARAAPIYGQHTREVLVEHGFKPAEIDKLVETGAIVAAD